MTAVLNVQSCSCNTQYDPCKDLPPDKASLLAIKNEVLFWDIIEV